jgi:NADH-quinone oxidoreductase subunit E
MALTEQTHVAAREIVARYPEGRSRSALLPMLHLVQAEQGYITAEGIAFCAAELGITQAEVSAVATFYTMYKRKPVGDYLVSVCTNLSCALLGGDEVFARLSQRLGVGHDQATEDGTITLEHAECLAACDYAPVVTVNYEFYDGVDPDAAEQLVDALRRGERPAPTRGGPLGSFAEASRQLAGFEDPRGEGVAGAGFGEPSVVGLLIAEEAGWDGAVAGTGPTDTAGSTDTANTAPTGDAAPGDAVLTGASTLDGARSGAGPAAGGPTDTKGA